MAVGAFDLGAFMAGIDAMTARLFRYRLLPGFGLWLPDPDSGDWLACTFVVVLHTPASKVVLSLSLRVPTFRVARYGVDDALSKRHELMRSLGRNVLLAAVNGKVAQDAQTFDRIMRLGSY